MKAIVLDEIVVPDGRRYWKCVVTPVGAAFFTTDKKGCGSCVFKTQDVCNFVSCAGGQYVESKVPPELQTLHAKAVLTGHSYGVEKWSPSK